MSNFVSPCVSAGQQQYFKVKPQSTSVVEGQTIELQCRIGNQAGSVQWSKDGFVLGKSCYLIGLLWCVLSSSDQREQAHGCI